MDKVLWCDRAYIVDLLRRATSGNAIAQYQYALLLPKFSIEYWKWLGRAARSGHRPAILDFVENVPPEAGPSAKFQRYQIGKYVEETFFDGSDTSDFGCVLYTKQYYLRQTRHCGNAVITWILCSKYLPIHKDLVPIIARLIWKTRKECLYK